MKKRKIEKEWPLLPRNTREYTKDNVRFVARPIKKGNNYRVLEIVGRPGKPYNSVPPLLLRLSDGTIVNTGDVKALMQKLSPGWDASGGYDYLWGGGKCPWPKGTQRRSNIPWVFYVQDDRLLAMRVYYFEGHTSNYAEKDGTEVWKGCVPAIGKPSDGKLYEFPLTEDEVIKIFGEPDKIREYFQP